ncbi:acetolactate decarboxylase [Acetobacterium sp. UBA5834]|jgi:acetolactate decarboxylase|uniref:acetolactate decarboxylase n=1 Tax=Acetobacterium sp. UBA5834 TaxID=1945907 RepID=UPI00257A3223|nr:acetolactate decarboxylase [Acetobacterium sp. UBA5834]
MRNNKLFQVSTLTAFKNKGYDGIISIKKMLTFGDTGFGTFDKLNGEMIVVDGVVYRALGDCSIEVAGLADTTPFATLGALGKCEGQILAINGDMICAGEKLSHAIAHPENPILARISGEFESIEIHGVWPQKNPYEALERIVSNQPVQVLKNISGCLVGIFCPASAQGMNMVGWHFHFLSDDKKIGGHVNTFSARHLKVAFNVKDELAIIK